MPSWRQTVSAKTRFSSSLMSSPSIYISVLFCAVHLLPGLCSADKAHGDKGNLNVGAASHERTLGDQALMEGKLQVALKHFEAAVKMNPQDHLNFYKRATAEMIDKKYAAAVRDLTKTLEIKPGYSQALDKRARIYMMEGRFDQAINDLRELLRSKPTDGELQDKVNKVMTAQHAWSTAQRFISQRNWQAARDHLNMALDVASDSVDLLLARAECNKFLGELENVLADTGKALKVQASSIAALVLRGQAYYLMMEMDLAQRHFREGLRMDPEHKECKENFRRIKKMEATMKAGDAEFAAGQFDEALKSYENGEKIDPSNLIFVGKMFLGQCRALNKLKRYKDAVRACSRGMDIPEDRHPKIDRINTLLSRADAMEGLEDIEESVRDCERALNLDNNHAESRERVERAKRLAKKSQMKDYYKILDVPKDANEKAIKKAYKLKALALHPDKVCGAGQCKSKEESDRANKQFHEVAEAYEVLSDPEKRAKFDNGEDPIHEQPQQQHGGGFPFGGGGGSHFTFHFG